MEYQYQLIDHVYFPTIQELELLYIGTRFTLDLLQSINQTMYI